MSLNVEDDASVASVFKNSKLLITPSMFYLTMLDHDWKDFMEVASSSVEKIYKVNLIGCFFATEQPFNAFRTQDTLIVNLSSRLGSIELRGETTSVP